MDFKNILLILLVLNVNKQTIALGAKHYSFIIESKSISDVLEYATDKNTLVVFDLDNTLVHPKQEAGSVQWFDYLLKQRITNGMTIEDALTEILPVSFEVQNNISLYPVEQTTVDVIKTLQQNDVLTVALTSRSDTLANRTHQQLSEIGITFALANEFNQELILDLALPVLLNHGIIFCANNNKGSILFNILNICNYTPSKIIFVDDKLEHLFEVERECFHNKTNFIGIRYGKLDSTVTRFNPALAEQELVSLLGTQALNNLLSS